MNVLKLTPALGLAFMLGCQPNNPSDNATTNTQALSSFSNMAATEPIAAANMETAGDPVSNEENTGTSDYNTAPVNPIPENMPATEGANMDDTGMNAESTGNVGVGTVSP